MAADTHLARFLDGAPAIFFTLRQDANGRLSLPFISGGMASFPASSPEEAADSMEYLRTRCHPGDFARLLAGLKESAQDMSPCCLTFRSASGSPPAVIELKAAPRADAAYPGSMEWHGFMHDITGRVHADEGLRDRESEYRSLAAHLPVPVFRYDRQCRRIYASPYVERLTGIPLKNLLAETPTKVPTVDAEQAARMQDGIQRVFDTGRKNEVMTRFVSGDGSVSWYRMTNVPEFGPDGSVRSVLSIGHDETRFHELQAELRRRIALEEQITSLAQAAPGFLFTGRVEADGHAHYPFASEGVVELFGVRPEEFRNNAEVLRARYHPDDLARVRKCLAKSARNLTPYSIEVRIAHPSRGERWIEIRGTPRRQEDGATEWHGMMFDITERKQVEHRLQQALAFSEGVINAIPDLLFEVDGDGRYLNVWTNKPELLAAPKELLLGKTVHDVLPPDAAAAAMTGIREADENGTSYGNLLRIDLPGGPAWFDHSISKKSGASPSDTRYLVLSRDVTERMRMEAALALREQEFRTLVENSPDAIARYGRNLRRKYVNPAFTMLFGTSREAMIDKAPSENPGMPNAAEFELNLEAVFASGKETVLEVHLLDNAGRQRCHLVNLTPEFGKDGAVESVLAVGRDITELNSFRKKIHQMAFYDALTSLPNRALFGDRLRQMITDAAWHGQRAGVMMIDMDRFKAVNDTMGHAIGDELLRETATRLCACVRAYDTVARLGGDEFAILLPEIRSGDDLGRIAGKILAAFDKRFLLDGKEVFVSCSVGIALYPDDSTKADDLVKYADSAMYFAKRSGRNNFRFYSKDLTESARERLTLEAELRHAIGRNELELHYQPKMSLEDGKMVGSEALLRWRHPRLGMVPPNHFIRIAEDTGLIVELGEWVLRQACRAAAAWNTGRERRHKVAINLSARQFQFQARDLSVAVADILAETACQPEWIELEITESLLLDEDGKTLDMLSALRSMGITIAIDDFGTGYSALGYLARFPVDTLKIDRSFIQSVTVDDRRAELVKAILSIARCLGQEVVAEGVETAEQAAFLKANGCRIAQGFLYGRPVPECEFAPGDYTVMDRVIPNFMGEGI